MVRQTVLLVVVLSAVFGGGWSVGPMPACVAEEVADLTDRLTTGLRVRDPDDVAFCERVAWLVRQGRLPAGLVDSTYTWAIQRGRKHPFPAFEHVIRLQAAKLGVPL